MALLVACFAAVHALYWTDMRMRAPLMPAITLTAIAGLAGVRARVTRCKALE
jgi:hypothetical protein